MTVRLELCSSTEGIPGRNPSMCSKTRRKESGDPQMRPDSVRNLDEVGVDSEPTMHVVSSTTYHCFDGEASASDAAVT